MAEVLPHQKAGRSRAFTLVELVVVVMILGILAGVAAPRLFDAGRDAAIAATMSNVQRVLDAADRYYAANGSFPRDYRTGEAPVELAGYMDTSIFGSPTPIGGSFDWNGPGGSLGAVGVSVHHALKDGRDIDVWLEIDQAYDDGDLATGWIRRSSTNGPHLMFVLHDP